MITGSVLQAIFIFYFSTPNACNIQSHILFKKIRVTHTTAVTVAGPTGKTKATPIRVTSTTMYSLEHPDAIQKT